MNSLPYPITLLSISSTLIPIVVWILSVRAPGYTLCLILVSVLLCSLEDILLYVFHVVNYNNLVVANFANLPILLSVSLAYYLHEDFTPPVRRVVGITGLAGIVSISVFLFLYPTDIYINAVQSIMYGCFVLFALYYFIHKVFFSTHFELAKHPMFYISAALFVYSFTVITVLTSYQLQLHGEIASVLWNIKIIAYIFYNATLAYGFYIFRKYRLAL